MSRTFKNPTTEHHETHPEADVPDIHPKDDHPHESTPHGGKKRSHRKEQNFPKESGETKMKIKTAPIMTAVALAMLFVFGSAINTQAKEVEFKFVGEKIVKIEADKLEAADFQLSNSQVWKWSNSKAWRWEVANFKNFTYKTDDLEKDTFNKDSFTAATFQKADLKNVDAKVFDAKNFDFTKSVKFEKANFRA